MKIGKVNVLKFFVTCAVMAMVLVCGVNTVSAYESSKKKKNESCYFAYVKAESSGKSYTFRGSLKPSGVPSDTTWEEYFSNMKITDVKLVTTGYCGENDHNIITAWIYVDDVWKELLYYDREEDKTYYQVDGFELKENYYDVKFTFSNRAASYTSTTLYARFAKEYSIFYELNGGKFENGTLDTYTMGADYTLPIPTREGCEFAGWTGTDLSTPTIEVVIKNGSTGNKKYSAVWKVKIIETKPDEKTTGADKDKVEPPAKTKIISATKKKALKKAKVSIKRIKGASGYQIQFSTTKKFKKVLVKKNVKNINMTITNKRLKNKKKLFVRARAYKLDGNTKIWAKKWSKVKRVTIK